MSDINPSTPAIDDPATLVAMILAGLEAAKEKADVEEDEDDDDEDDEADDESDDGDDSDDDDGDDDDDDESDDDDDSDDDDEEEEDEDEEGEEELETAAEKAEVETLEAESVPAVVPVPGPVSDVLSPDHAQHLRLLEALVFAGTQALDVEALSERLPNDANVERLLADLGEMYANRGVNLVKVAGGYAFRTASDLSEKLKIERPVTRKLSRAAIETLAIIAYHQPVTRAEIEQVRGVGLSKGTLDLLFEQNWIKPMGRRRAPGKPVTWGTTDFFLEHFGLPSLDDLPGHEEMKAAGLLDPRAQPPIFRPDEPDLPLEPTEDEADEPLAAEEESAKGAAE
jgi:segregation and condensation protein B